MNTHFNKSLSEALNPTTHMQFEAILARGLRLWVNGKEPLAHDWSWSETEDGIKTAERVEGGSLPFDEFLLDGFKFDAPINSFSDDHKPRRITLLTDKGEINMRVVDMKFGNPDEAEYDEPTDSYPELRVKLANGKTVELDETMLYVRATS
jgi:hypothetical protein